MSVEVAAVLLGGTAMSVSVVLRRSGETGCSTWWGGRRRPGRRGEGLAPAALHDGNHALLVLRWRGGARGVSRKNVERFSAMPCAGGCHKTVWTGYYCSWWLERGGPTRSHSEHGSETSQR